MFRVTLAPPAVRSWSSLPRWARTRFNAAFDLLEKDPRGTSADLDTHQLFGHRNVWPLRIPPYRGTYAIEGSEVVMIVFGRRESYITGSMPWFHRIGELSPRQRSLSADRLSTVIPAILTRCFGAGGSRRFAR